MQEWLTATISAASAIGGGMVVAVSNYVINRVQARDTEHAELRAATTAFLQSVDMITQQLRTERKPGPVVTAINRASGRFAPTFDANIGWLHQRIFTPHLQGVVQSFSVASNRLLLVAPNQMLETMGKVAELLAHADRRDDEWDKKWDDTHAELVVIARRLLGQAASGNRKEEAPSSAEGTAATKATSVIPR